MTILFDPIFAEIVKVTHMPTFDFSGFVFQILKSMGPVMVCGFGIYLTVFGLELAIVNFKRSAALKARERKLAADQVARDEKRRQKDEDEIRQAEESRKTRSLARAGGRMQGRFGFDAASVHDFEDFTPEHEDEIVYGGYAGAMQAQRRVALLENLRNEHIRELTENDDTRKQFHDWLENKIVGHEENEERAPELDAFEREFVQ